jgi:integrase
VSVRAGRAVRRYKAVKSDELNDLVFQSVKDGKPMRDNNILTRFIKPAARQLGLGFVNWRCLRTSYGTWLKRHGADMKDIQGQLRHSRISTTMDIYVQDIPQQGDRRSELRAVSSGSRLERDRRPRRARLALGAAVDGVAGQQQ